MSALGFRNNLWSNGRGAWPRRVSKGALAGFASLLLGGALLLPALVSESEPIPEGTEPRLTVAMPHGPNHRTGQGMRVFLDDESRPTVPAPAPADAVAARSLAVAPGPELLQEMVAPGGGKIVRLDGHFQSYSVARLGPDGKVTVGCVDGTDEPVLLRQPAAGAASRSEFRPPESGTCSAVEPTAHCEVPSQP